GEVKAFQHRGFGEKLLRTAEEVAKEKFDKIAVISAVGVRNYYRKFGYRKSFEYMLKRL
ncbi:MAG: GNAT family N-acetyltransferase, partial [Archaeoglobaceae archaeon]